MDQATILSDRYVDAVFARTLLDIGALDARMQEAVASHGSPKDYRVALWRQEPDETGCNWDARLARLARNPGEHSRDLTCWDVVPQLRERFNLI
jgi:hypothetical protein